MSLVTLLLLLLGCVHQFPSPCVPQGKPIQDLAASNEYRQLVDDVLSLLDDNKYAPDHFIRYYQSNSKWTNGKARNPRDFDVNQLFCILNHLSIQQDYVLDYVWRGNPIIYAKQIGTHPYRNYKAFIQKQYPGVFNRYSNNFSSIPDDIILDYSIDYLQYIHIDGTAIGYFQYVVMYVMGDQFYLYWHANYDDTVIVCSKKSLPALFERARADLEVEVDADTVSKARQIEDFSPSVEITEDSVHVTCIVFTKWGGFYRNIYKINRRFPHFIKIMESNQIIQFNCGIEF